MTLELSKLETEYLKFVIESDLEIVDGANIVSWIPEKLMAKDILERIRQNEN